MSGVIFFLNLFKQQNNPWKRKKTRKRRNETLSCFRLALWTVMWKSNISLYFHNLHVFVTDGGRAERPNVNLFTPKCRTDFRLQTTRQTPLSSPGFISTQESLFLRRTRVRSAVVFKMFHFPVN